MSFFASVLRAAYKLSGAKKAFTLPEDEMLKVIEKQNRSRGVFTPKDHEAHLLRRRGAVRRAAGL